MSDDHRKSGHQEEDPLKLYVGKLDYCTTKECLKECFEKYGEVVDGMLRVDSLFPLVCLFGFLLVCVVFLS